MANSSIDGKRKLTVYEKLGLLNDEMCAGIKKATPDSPTQIESEIAELRHAAYRERSPEAEFAILLYRKYVDIVTHSSQQRYGISAESRESEATVDNNQSAFFEFQSYALDGIGEQISGLADALKRNIFWYRLVTVMFTFIAMVIFSSSRYIANPYLKMNEAFTVSNECLIPDIR